MTTRTTPPFRADHVGSFLRPKYLLDAREKKARGEITPAELRAVEDRAIAEVVRMQEDIGLQSITDGEFRRTYFHIDFLAAAGRRQDASDVVTIRRPDGTEELAPPGDARGRPGPAREGHPARRLRVPAQPDAAHAEGDDPVADDAAFPRRPRGHQQGALPGSRGVLPGRRRRVRRRAALARRRRMHLRADGRHQPRLPVRSEDAGGGAAARRRSATSCRTATRRSSIASSRRSPPA